MSRENRKHIPQNAQLQFSGVLFDVYQWEQQRFDGTYATFERLARPDTVQVLAITTEGKILLLQEEQPDRLPYLSIPGGRMDEGEEPRSACLRELLEETGYVPETCDLWFTDRPASKIDWNVYTFIAKGCAKKQEQHLDAGEKIIQKEVTQDEFLNIIFDPMFKVGEVTLAFAKLLAQGKRSEAIALLTP